MAIETPKTIGTLKITGSNPSDWYAGMEGEVMDFTSETSTHYRLEFVSHKDGQDFEHCLEIPKEHAERMD